MKLVRFRVNCQAARHRRVGVLRDGSVIDVTAAHRALLRAESGASMTRAKTVAEAVTPPSMIDILRTGDRAFEVVKRCETAHADGILPNIPGQRVVYDRTEVTLLSPLERPNTLRDCSVYERHLCNCRGIEPGELPDAYYEYPHYYSGNPGAVVDPNTDVVWPSSATAFDFELEIAAVIGRQGRNINPAAAEEYIAGFTVFNDFTARDIQGETRPLKLGPSKSKDFANGLGPSLVTADSIDPTGLRTAVRVSGEQWSTNTTGGMTHSWGEILAYVSDGVTIQPGDVVGSGTVPQSCSLELDRWLQPGDRLELEIEGIGTLAHTVVEPS
jgi:2-keto-4-pentenoate hydratase/2-oxohepta-3-ene-1,7-dioic acid hydratase in catechol pathway